MRLVVLWPGCACDEIIYVIDQRGSRVRPDFDEIDATSFPAGVTVRSAGTSKFHADSTMRDGRLSVAHNCLRICVGDSRPHPVQGDRFWLEVDGHVAREFQTVATRRPHAGRFTWRSPASTRSASAIAVVANPLTPTTRTLTATETRLTGSGPALLDLVACSAICSGHSTCRAACSASDSAPARNSKAPSSASSCRSPKSNRCSREE